MSSHRFWPSLGGVIAIVLWSTTIGLSRILIESLGMLTTGTAVYLSAGVLGCTWLLTRPNAGEKLRKLPVRYLLGCGGLFILYMVCIYAAMGLATGRRQVLVVGVINYLWPGLTLALSIPILKKKPRILFPFGALLAFAGAAIAMLPQENFNWANFAAGLHADAWPYALALTAAVTWAFYSNLVKRWAGASDGGAVPLFILATGIVMATMRVGSGESSEWTPAVVALVALLTVGPALVAYILWEAAMRRGNMTLVASIAYSTPLLSTVTSCAMLGVLPGASLWVACGLVAAGAVICKLSIRDRAGGH